MDLKKPTQALSWLKTKKGRIKKKSDLDNILCKLMFSSSVFLSMA